jgi:HEAT repeat protein
VIAYHFVADTLRDGRPVPADGEWLVHDGDLVMCESGLHASLHPYDALQYAPGPILCMVQCEDVTNGDDKLVCRRRKIVRRIDATTLMRRFARESALSVIHLWDAPDVVRRYLETGDESLRAAARAAAMAAARAAAGEARRRSRRHQ